MKNDEDIVNIAIKENMKYALAYAMCLKTDWGKKMIQEINAVFRKQRSTKEYRECHERWLDVNSLPGFRKAYDTIFRKENPR